MELRIFCIILLTIGSSYTQQCSVNFIQARCTYLMSCLNYIENADYSRFSRRPYHYDLPGDEPCPKTINYGGYMLYPIEVVFKQQPKDYNTPVPNVNSWGNGILNIMHSLDLSDDGYTQMPILKTMPNLAILNMSNNLLTTAVLANPNELNMLTEIDLSHNTIKDIEVADYPHYKYKKIKKIDLSHNYLVTLPDAVFDDFDDLQTLDLSYNYIDTLSQATFEGIKKLLDLNLSNNRLTDINSSLFRFTELQILNLNGNRIKDLSLTDFEKLGRLETLDLSSNVLKNIDANLFRTMISIQSLDLSNNELESVNKEAFLFLTSLNNVNISKNKFKTLPKGLFKNTSISTFSIVENKLEGALSEGMLEGLNVTKLDLSNQFLTEIEDNAFTNLDSLETLLLYSNRLRALGNMSFKHLVNLQQLDLSNNQLVNIDFAKEDLVNLQALLLVNNRLTELKHEQLKDLYSLKYLDLSENQISRLESSSFRSLRSLINLQMNSNPLTGALETGTFNGLVSLPSLDISRNKYTLVQNASFSDMTELKGLNMSRCEINEVQYNAFINTGYIDVLDLSHNKLSNFVVNTTELIALSSLMLGNNMINTVSPSSLTGITRLTKLDLSYNLIEKLANASFDDLINLDYLDLSYNENLNFTLTALEKNKNINTLCLSGIKYAIDFSGIKEDSPVLHLYVSNSSVQNISQLHMKGMSHADFVDLSRNNVSKLVIGDFAGITALRILDLSFNKISAIQPGVFKDSTLLHTLNISHNYLSSVSYGIFHGLIYLNILDMSYNNIKDLQSERFYEVKSLTQLIVDYNDIDSINAEEFIGTSLSRLSIGNNPLPCQILVKLRKRGVPFEITAIIFDEHSNENVNGVTCNKAKTDRRTIEPIVTPSKTEDNNILNELRFILYNLTNNVGQNSSEIQYLKNISDELDKSNSIHEDQLTNMFNLTAKLVDINKNTNTILSEIIKSLEKTKSVDATTTTTPEVNETIQYNNTHTTILPTMPSNISNERTIVNNTNKDQSADIIPLINKQIKEALLVEKQNILNEIKNRFATNSNRSIPPSTSISNEKLTSDSDKNNKSVFVETCVTLILVILVGLVLFKFYKSRMFIRNRFSYSTRELPGAMENSNL